MHRLPAVLVSLALLLCHASAGCAAVSKDEKNLDKEMAGLNRTAAEPGGEQAVLARIEKDLKVPAAQVQALRDQGLGYGDVVIVLSLSQAMPGGITDGNIERVLSLRKGPPPAGWGAVARQVNAKLGRTVSQIKRVNNEARRVMKPGAPKPAAASSASEEKAQPEKGRRWEFPGEGKSLPQGRAAD
jgi:hypothetical protein